MNYRNIEENSVIEAFDVEDKLPDLDEKQINHAHAPDQVNWAYRQLSQGIGYFWDMPEVGIAMQVTSERTMRVISVVNHDFSMLMLACIRRTLEHLGMTLETDSAVVMPFKGAPSEYKNNNSAKVSEDSFIEVV